MFDVNGQYNGLGKRRNRTAPPPSCPPPSPPSPSPAIAADLHSSLLPFLSLPPSSCPPSFSQWLSLPDVLLTRHLRNSREVALLQQIASSATQLDVLVERLYDAIVEGESLEHVQRHLPHRCPSLPEPPFSSAPSDSSESSSSSSSSDSSAPSSDNATLTALAASLAPFFHCSFPSAHHSSFPSLLSASVSRHVRAISGVFVDLTAVLLELQSGLSALQSFQQLNVRLSEELQLEGCDALAATKAAVAGLEGHLVDRITALLSARLTYQRQQTEAVHSHSTALAAVTVTDTAATAQSQPAPPSSALAGPFAETAAIAADPASVDTQLRRREPLPPDSPCPSVASSSSSSTSSSSTSSSSLSPNTRLDVILGLQPAAGTKRKAQSALDAPLAVMAPQLEQVYEQSNDHRSQPQPTTKRKRIDQSNQSEAVQLQPSVRATTSDQDCAVVPTSMRALFTSEALGTDGGAAPSAQTSVLDSPQVVAAVPCEELPAVTHSAALPVRPTSPACDMQLSLSSSASSSGAPASPSSCPPSPAVSPLISASQPTPAAAHSASLSRLTALGARSRSIDYVARLATEKQTLSTPSVEPERLIAIVPMEVANRNGAAGSVPLSPNVAMSVDDSGEDNERQSTLLELSHNPASETGRAAASNTALAAVVGVADNDAFLPPVRTVSLTRCSQERVDVAGMAGMDADGGANVTMPPVELDPLQLHSSQVQTMV